MESQKTTTKSRAGRAGSWATIGALIFGLIGGCAAGGFDRMMAGDVGGTAAWDAQLAGLIIGALFGAVLGGALGAVAGVPKDSTRSPD